MKNNFVFRIRFFNSFVRLFSIHIFLLVFLLFQGCSSSTADAQIVKSSINESSGEVPSEESIVEEPVEIINGPKLEVEKSIYDFGQIKPNSTNTAVFNFTNTGNEPLIITEVQK
ncbi:DUF1573 domain-containing protein, partial [Planctomycetota bacterium]